jgi:hypothetical protein
MPMLNRFSLYVLVVGAILSTAYLQGLYDEKINGTVIYTYVAPTGNQKFFQDILFSLASAVIVSSFVFELIERLHKKRMNRAENETFGKTISNAVRSAFSSFYDEKLIRKVTETVFGSPFVRDGFKVTYTLEDYSDLKGVFLFRTHYEFKVKNSGRTASVLPMVSMISNKFAAYKDLQDRPQPEIVSYSLGKKEKNSEEILKINEKIEENKHTTKILISEVSLKSEESISVSSEMISYKFFSDSETFRMTYPASDIEIVISNKTSCNLEFGISPIGDYDLSELSISSGDRSRFFCSTDDVLLPNNGWVLYWYDLNAFK